MSYFSAPSSASINVSSKLDVATKIFTIEDFRGSWSTDTSTVWTSLEGLSMGESETATVVADSVSGEITLKTGPASFGWDVTTAVYDSVFSVAGQELNPRSLKFRPDGLKMYVMGTSGDDINTYTLGVAWDVTTAVYDGDGARFSVAVQELTPLSLTFSPDGLKMYVMGTSGQDINTYNLGVAWDVTTAVYASVFSVATQETAPNSLKFRPDGLRMYVMGNNGDDINTYNLSVAWDVSTAVYASVFSVAAQELTPSSLVFRPDGLVMYVMGASGDDINTYTLGVAWDVTTAVYDGDGARFSVAAQELDPQSLVFRPDGLKMYVMGIAGDDINTYTLTAAPITVANYGSAFLGSALNYKASNLTIGARLKLDSNADVAIAFGVTDALALEMPFYLTAATDTITGDATNTCGIAYDTQGTTSQWFLGGIKAGAATAATFAGSAPVNNTYVRLEVTIDASGNVTGSINGVSIGTVNNAITNTTSVTPCIVITPRGAGNVQKTCTVDYIYVNQTRV